MPWAETQTHIHVDLIFLASSVIKIRILFFPNKQVNTKRFVYRYPKKILRMWRFKNTTIQKQQQRTSRVSRNVINIYSQATCDSQMSRVSFYFALTIKASARYTRSEMNY